jgi:hypothetical protein
MPIPFDSSTAAAAFSHPGIDPRQWFSFGTVDPDTPQARSVNFTTEYGPLVNVTLRPSGAPVVCRVLHEVAGNGEGDWFPFLAGDEVGVVIPEGDEKAGCTIIGRLNQEIDAWPMQVAGMDATQNNFAFRRVRVPYVFETASNYLVRDATTGAFFSMKDGTVTLSNLDNAFFTLGPDLLGLQSGDATALVQVDVAAQQVVVEANGTKMVFDAAESMFYTTGTLQLGTAGNQAAEHATSIEAVCSLLQAFFAQIAITSPGMLVGASFAPPAVAALLNTALPLAAALPIAPIAAALTQALSVPKKAGVTAGVGAPGILIG